MTAHDFTYWLQGFAEIQNEPPSPEQWQIIKDHLAVVFTKVTPQRAGQGLPNIGQQIGSPLHQQTAVIC